MKEKIKANWQRKTVSLGAAPLLVVAVFLVSISAAFFARDTANIPVQVSIGLTIIAEIVVVVFACFFAKLWPLKKFLFFGIKKWWFVLVGVGVGVFCYVVLQVVAFVSFSITGEAVGNSDTSQELSQMTGVGGILFLVLVVSVVAPFIEEVYFRGVIIGALRNSSWSKPVLSVVVSAVSFGVMHFQGFNNLTSILVLVWITIMGGIFAVLVLTTKSVWTSVSAHMSYNLVTSMVLILAT